jgi:pimeloyl-ACP methyl ester carboxylesterase
MDQAQVEAIKNYRPLAQLIPSHWRESAYVVGDGTRLVYSRTGDDKPALILLHGYGSAGYTWLRVAQALDGVYDVIMPDFRGHGRSGAPDNGFSLDILTSDIVQLIDQLELDKPYIVGHSLGADIAARLASDYPHRVGAIVLEDPPMRPFSTPLEGEWFENWMTSMRDLKTQSHPERLVSSVRQQPPNMPIWGELDLVPQVEAEAQFNLDVIAYSGSMDYSAASPERISRIDCPLLLVTGNPQRGGHGEPEAIATIMQASHNGASVQIDSSHFIHAEQLDQFIEAVQSFLNDV